MNIQLPTKKGQPNTNTNIDFKQLVVVGNQYYLTGNYIKVQELFKHIHQIKKGLNTMLQK